MARIEFLIEGKPLPQERPFVTRRGTFDRSRSKAKKKEIGLIALAASKVMGWKMDEKPVGVYLVFNNPNPRADLDNLTKLVMDALSGVLWKDDSQVMRFYADKNLEKSVTPHTTVCVWHYGETNERSQ